MIDSTDNEFREYDDPNVDGAELDEQDWMDADPVPDPDHPEGPPPSGPEEVGIPEYADDDSYADAERDVSREADDPSPAAVPLEREDPTIGLDKTDEDHRRGETLDERLAQEEPDVFDEPER